LRSNFTGAAVPTAGAAVGSTSLQPKGSALDIFGQPPPAAPAFDFCGLGSDDDGGQEENSVVESVAGPSYVDRSDDDDDELVVASVV
jgi:hypothetical protein